MGHHWEPYEGKQWYVPLKGNWNYLRTYKGKQKLLEPVEVPQGACYAFTEATFDKLGGFGESIGHFGCFDRDLAINCFFQDIPLLVNTEVHSMHWYRTKRPYSAIPHSIWYGYVQCLRRMIRPDIWEKYFLPYIPINAQRDSVMQYLMHDVHLAAEQTLFEKKKVRTDEELVKWIGIKELQA